MPNFAKVPGPDWKTIMFLKFYMNLIDHMCQIYPSQLIC